MIWGFYTLFFNDSFCWKALNTDGLFVDWFSSSVNSRYLVAHEVAIFLVYLVSELVQEFIYTVWAKKQDHFWKCITPVYDDVEGIQYIKMFSSITSKIDILNVAVFKYSLHQKYQLI